MSAAHDDAQSSADAAPDAPYAFPEVTRALRAFGSRRGAPGSDHDRFFAPLVDALRAARDTHRTGAEWRAVNAVDAARVDASLRATLATLAAERAAGSAPDARALEAELEELCEPLFDALGALGAEADAVRGADEGARPEAWRAWAARLAAAFAAADRAWIAALPALADARGGRGRLWRRVLRGAGGLPPRA